MQGMYIQPSKMNFKCTWNCQNKIKLPDPQLAENPLPFVEASDLNLTINRFPDDLVTGGKIFSHHLPRGTAVPLLSTSLTYRL